MNENYSIAVEHEVQHLGEKFLSAHCLAEQIAATPPHERDEMLRELKRKTIAINSAMQIITE